MGTDDEKNETIAERAALDPTALRSLVRQAQGLERDPFVQRLAAAMPRELRVGVSPAPSQEQIEAQRAADEAKAHAARVAAHRQRVADDAKAAELARETEEAERRAEIAAGLERVQRQLTAVRAREAGPALGRAHRG